MSSKPSYDELESSLKKYRTMVENANDSIFVVQDGFVKYANPKALEISGVSAEQLGKMHFTEYLHPEERALVADRHMRRLKGEKLPSVYPIRLKNRQGQVIWSELNSVFIEWEGRPATLNVIREIGGQKLIEENAFQTESLSALRTLAGGLAHSLNNLLMGIQGRASLLGTLTHSDYRFYEYLQGIEACVQEASRLTKQVEGFAQSGNYVVGQVDLNEVIESVLKGFQHVDKPVALQTNYETTLWTVSADHTQMELVIMNLLLNAWQAISHSGRITIATENVTLPEARAGAHDTHVFNYVKCLISDTGCGINKRVLKRIYEPFFTTKDLSRHRGLGLSSVYGIIKNHNGLIDIESEVDTGTQVSIFLPAIPKSS